MKYLFKKLLSVLSASAVIFSCMVFASPSTSAEDGIYPATGSLSTNGAAVEYTASDAAAGRYLVRVYICKWAYSGSVEALEHDYDCDFDVFYRGNNGTDVDTKCYTFKSAIKANEFNQSGSHDVPYYAVLDGFPSGSHLRIYKKTDNKTGLFIALSVWNAKTGDWVQINSDTGGQYQSVEGKTTGFLDLNISIDNDYFPYTTSSSVSMADQEITIPESGNVSAVMTADAHDQYGINMIKPTFTYTGIYGVKRTQNKYKLTVTANKVANAKDANYSSETVTASFGSRNSSHSATVSVKATLKINNSKTVIDLYEPTYDNRDKAGLSYSFIDQYGNEVDSVDLNANNKIDGTFYMYITNNSTKTAVVNSLKHTAYIADFTIEDNTLSPGERIRVQLKDGSTAATDDYICNIIIEYTLEGLIDWSTKQNAVLYAYASVGMIKPVVSNTVTVFSYANDSWLVFPNSANYHLTAEGVFSNLVEGSSTSKSTHAVATADCDIYMDINRSTYIGDYDTQIEVQAMGGEKAGTGGTKHGNQMTIFSIQNTLSTTSTSSSLGNAYTYYYVGPYTYGDGSTYTSPGRYFVSNAEQQTAAEAGSSTSYTTTTDFINTYGDCFDNYGQGTSQLSAPFTLNGYIPETLGDYKLKVYITNSNPEGDINQNYSDGQINYTFHVYDKTELYSNVQMCMDGLLSCFFDVSLYGTNVLNASDTTSLQGVLNTAAEVASRDEAVQTDITEANTLISTMWLNLHASKNAAYGSVSLKESYYAGGLDEEPAETASYSYLVPVDQNIPVSFANETYLAKTNRHTKIDTVLMDESKTVSLDYKYWNIDFTDLNSAIAVAPEDMSVFSNVSAYNSALSAAQAIDQTQTDAPENQGDVDTAAENLTVAMRALQYQTYTITVTYNLFEADGTTLVQADELADNGYTVEYCKSCTYGDVLDGTADISDGTYTVKGVNFTPPDKTLAQYAQGEPLYSGANIPYNIVADKTITVNYTVKQLDTSLRDDLVNNILANIDHILNDGIYTEESVDQFVDWFDEAEAEGILYKSYNIFMQDEYDAEYNEILDGFNILDLIPKAKIKEENQSEISITEDNIIKGIDVNQTVETVISKFDIDKTDREYKGEYRIENYSGKVLSADELAGTGCKLILSYNGVDYESFDILIMGEVNGDGLKDDTDFNLVYNYSLVDSSLFEEGTLFYKAADLNGDGNIDLCDAAMMIGAK